MALFMGVYHGGQGTRPSEFGVGTLMQIAHPQILSCFRISMIRLLALHLQRTKCNVYASYELMMATSYTPPPHQAFGIRPSSPRIPSRFTPLTLLTL